MGAGRYTRSIVIAKDPKSVDVDGPHTAIIDSNMHNATESLCYMSGGSCVQWISISPRRYGWVTDASTNYDDQTAPVCTLTGVRDWQPFKFIINYESLGFDRSMDFSLPYYFTPGFDKICAFVTVVSDIKAHYRVRLTAKTLIDAVTSTVGYGSETSTPVNSLDMLNWSHMNQNNGEKYFSFTSRCEIVPPSEYNEMAIGVDLCMDQNNWTSFDSGISAAANYGNIFLQSLYLFDFCGEYIP